MEPGFKNASIRLGQGPWRKGLTGDSIPLHCIALQKERGEDIEAAVSSRVMIIKRN